MMVQISGFLKILMVLTIAASPQLASAGICQDLLLALRGDNERLIEIPMINEWHPGTNINEQNYLRGKIRRLAGNRTQLYIADPLNRHPEFRYMSRPLAFDRFDEYPGKYITHFEVDASGRYVFIVEADGRLKIFDLRSGELKMKTRVNVREPRGDALASGWVNKFAITRDWKYFKVASASRELTYRMDRVFDFYVLTPLGSTPVRRGLRELF